VISFICPVLRLKQSLKDVIIDCIETDARMIGEISLRWVNDIGSDRDEFLI
jgi:hypothetical protein